MALQVKFKDGETKWMATVSALAAIRRNEAKLVEVDKIVSDNEAAASEVAIDAKREKASAKAGARTARAMTPADLG
jgi:hypothetical protein